MTKMKKKMMILSFHLIVGSLFAVWFFNTKGLRCNSAVSSYSWVSKCWVAKHNHHAFSYRSFFVLLYQRLPIITKVWSRSTLIRWSTMKWRPTRQGRHLLTRALADVPTDGSTNRVWLSLDHGQGELLRISRTLLASKTLQPAQTLLRLHLYIFCEQLQHIDLDKHKDFMYRVSQKKY